MQNDSPRLPARAFVLLYGVACYLIFLATFLYALGFVGNIGVPKGLDSTANTPFWGALAVNAALLTIFALQHSLMARPAFKRRLTRLVPDAAERSTYVLLSSAALVLLFWQWRPMGSVVWQVDGTALRGALYVGFGFGWLLVLVTTFLINHFDLFGLRQVWSFFRQQPDAPLRFVTPGPYRWVRHPLYVGWLFAFWCTPLMTIAHLVFAVATTVYILVAIRLEERDLVATHGRDYERYRERTPMLVPRFASPQPANNATTRSTDQKPATPPIA